MQCITRCGTDMISTTLPITALSHAYIPPKHHGLVDSPLHGLTHNPPAPQSIDRGVSLLIVLLLGERVPALPVAVLRTPHVHQHALAAKCCDDDGLPGPCRQLIVLVLRPDSCGQSVEA